MESEKSVQPIAYRVNDAALAIGLSRSRIWQLIELGELRAHKLGGATLIPASALQALVDNAPLRQPKPVRE